MAAANPSPTKLAALVREFSPPQCEEPNAADPVALLVHSFMLADATRRQAEEAMHALRKHTVDFNDLRVSLVNELVEVIGPKYPFAVARCSALRRVLYDVYRKHHTVSFEHLAEKQKKDIRSYLERLDGMTPYVAARMMLLAWDIHAVPVDGTTHAVLLERKVLAPGTPMEDAIDRMQRAVRAEKARQTHFALVAAADARHAVERAPRERSRSGAKG